LLSLRERIELLENDLGATPMRISVYRHLPFAILRYDPHDEWRLRREAGLLATRLSDVGKKVRIISLAMLLWKAIDTTDGRDALLTPLHAPARRHP
jgi:hypothetical protein